MIINKELIRAAKKGDDNAMKKILDIYYPLIKKTGIKYFSKVEDSDDFEQIARIGIWDAVKRYRLVPTYVVEKVDGKIVNFKLKYKKDRGKFGGFVYFSIKKLTNIAVRKNKHDNENVYLDDRIKEVSGSVGYFNKVNDIADGVRERLYKKLLKGVIKVNMFEMLMASKVDFSIRKRLMLSLDEFESLKKELMEMTREEFATIAIS